jgi:hypothetical protein
VGAATTGLIEVNWLRSRRPTEGVVEQGVGVGQAEAAAEEDGKQQCAETTTATSHE